MLFSPSLILSFSLSLSLSVYIYIYGFSMCAWRFALRAFQIAKSEIRSPRERKHERTAEEPFIHTHGNPENILRITRLAEVTRELLQLSSGQLKSFVNYFSRW